MNDNDQPILICLTPMKNEAWVLERFLQCASVWADHIIIADQCSEDGSREIALRSPKVTLVDNASPHYDEGERQRLLLEVARRIPGKRILIALDADEMLTANWHGSVEWQRVREAKPGTVLTFQWVNVMPDFRQGWLQDDLPLGFVDDESEHRGQSIHSTRIPAPSEAPRLRLDEIKVLHYQFTDWERMKSKQRWYQCWERIHHPAKRAVTIYRQYHHMDAIPADRLRPLQPEWLDGYMQTGIDMTTVRREEYYRWDRDVAQWLAEQGPEKFRKCDIWEVDWDMIARGFGMEPPRSLADPRTPFEQRVHRWLHRTQGTSLDQSVRLRQRLLRLLGW